MSVKKEGQDRQAAEGGLAAASAAKEETVEVFVPADPSLDEDKDTHLFVGVNGRTWMLERGMTHCVPASAAAVIGYSLAAKAKAEQYKKRVTAQMNEKKGSGLNPHLCALAAYAACGGFYGRRCASFGL